MESVPFFTYLYFCIFRFRTVSFVFVCVYSGSDFTNKETFGQFPLQVNGFRDIHESLEAGTAQGEIETLAGNASTSKSGQEVGDSATCVHVCFIINR